MKKKLLTYFVSLCIFFTGVVDLNAQVSIGGNSNQPKIPESFSILELISAPTTVVGGLRLPQLTEADKTSIEPQLIAKAAEAKGLFIYNSTENCIEYWNGSKWVSPTAGITLPWQDTADPSGSSTEVGIDAGIFHTGSVTIGSKTVADNPAILDVKADPSAILDVNATSKGVLLPRVALSSTTDATTIPSPAVGLLVYNTGTHPNFSTEGYMFWNGHDWMLFSSSLAIAASAIVSCSGTHMAPNQQVVGGTPIIPGTLMQIPYTGSNGGFYQGVTLTSIDNPSVTATLSDGVLAPGNGFLNFALEGTPTIDQQAPNGIIFDLTPLFQANQGTPGIRGLDDCHSVVIGDVLEASVETAAFMGRLMLVNDNTPNDDPAGPNYNQSNWAFQGNTPDGKYSIRVRLQGTSTTTLRQGNQGLNIQIRSNLTTTEHIIYNNNTEYGGYIGNAGHVDIPAKRWGGMPNNDGIWSNTGTSYWGNMGIYDASNDGPEYRRHTWIPIGEDNKVAYEALVMAALDTKNPTTAGSPSLLKVFIKITQVTAR